MNDGGPLAASISTLIMVSHTIPDYHLHQLSMLVSSLKHLTSLRTPSLLLLESIIHPFTTIILLNSTCFPHHRQPTCTRGITQDPHHSNRSLHIIHINRRRSHLHHHRQGALYITSVLVLCLEADVDPEDVAVEAEARTTMCRRHLPLGTLTTNMRTLPPLHRHHHHLTAFSSPPSTLTLLMLPFHIIPT